VTPRTPLCQLALLGSLLADLILFSFIYNLFFLLKKNNKTKERDIVAFCLHRKNKEERERERERERVRALM